MLAFIFQTVVISLSGVLSPGPITVAVIGHGTRSRNAGAFVAIGHALVEFPFIALIYFGLAEFLKVDSIRAVVFIVGGFFLIIMGVRILLGIRKKEKIVKETNLKTGPIVSGVVLTAGNAYFLLWWGTVGAALIAKGSVFGLYGLAVLAVSHWLCDLLWLRMLSGMTYKGSGVFGKKFTISVALASGVFLMAFGINFIMEGISLKMLS